MKSRAVKAVMSQPSDPQASEWKSALVLNQGEMIHTYWYGDRAIMQMGVVNGRSQMTEVRKHGVLVLTSQKLVFLEKRGVFNKSFYMDVGLELESIGGVSMGGLIMKYVSIGSMNGEFKFHLSGIDNNNFESFRGAVTSEIEARKVELQKQSVANTVQAMVDFSTLRDYMTKGGITVQTVKCPQCKAPLTMPETGSLAKCSYCGSTVYASDIMDKFKQLIG
jgi:hypothetical protein